MWSKSRESTKRTCPKTGNKSRQPRNIWLFWVMPVMGFLALLWFLVRVIPKPSRAAYPCQRVAFPLASSFVIWLTGLVGSAVAMKKARVLVKDRRFLSALFFVTVAVMAISLPITYHAPLGISAYPDDKTDEGWYDPFVHPENSPLDPNGVPAGINPGRVVWNYNPDATSWNGSGNFIDYIDQAVVDQMLAETLLDLVEADTEADAWDQLFKYHNGGTGYGAGEKIAIKLNLNRLGSHGASNNNGQIVPQMVLALLKQLVYNAEVDDDDIIFYEASKAITDDIFDLCRNFDGDDPDSEPDFPDVHFADSKGDNGRDPIVMDSNAQMIWSDDLLDPTEDDSAPEDMYLPTCVTQADYLINLGSLKGHDLVGSTACAKNHFGTFRKLNGDAGPKPAGVHPYIAPHSYQINASWWLDQRPMGTYNPLVDIMGHEHLGAKTILYLLDGLYVADAQNTLITTDHKWQTKPFGDGIGSGSYDWTSTLLASQDPVAIESVALDFLRSEPAIQNYCSLDPNDTPDNYLHEAAEADSPPSGHVYDFDPVGTGTPLDSLGVHEHWNNEFKRQYTGNLKTDDGIELIRSPRVWGDINGGGVNMEDFVFIADNWLKDDCDEWNGWCDGADIDQDHNVNFDDYVYVAGDWGTYVIE